MTDIDARLREDVHNLGALLGQTIQAHLGEDFLQRIERIRLGAKQGRKADQAANEALLSALQDLPDSQLLPVCRAFTGGWISSFAFSKLLKDIRKDNMLPPGKHRELLRLL